MTTEVATSITMVDAIAAMMALLWSQPHGDREIYLSPEASIAATPTIVDAFVKTSWVDGVNDPGRTLPPRPIPLIAQAAGRMTQAAGRSEAGTAIDLG